MTKPNDIVYVHIVAVEKVAYDAVVKMTFSEFKMLDHKLDNSGFDEKIENRVLDYIDRDNHLVESSDPEIHTFELVNGE